MRKLIDVVRDSSVPRSTKTLVRRVSPQLSSLAASNMLFVFQVLVKEHRKNGGSQSRQELSLDDGTGTFPLTAE